MNRQKTEFLGQVKIVYETIIKDIYSNAFVQIHRMCHIKNESECKLWTLWELNIGSLIVTNVLLWCRIF